MMTWIILTVAHKLLIERLELGCIAGYLLFAWHKRDQHPITIVLFCAAAVFIGVDVYYFQGGVRYPTVLWWYFNTPIIFVVAWAIYAKLFKKSVQLVYRKCLAVLFMFLE
jgi:hypothetical protein